MSNTSVRKPSLMSASGCSPARWVRAPDKVVCVTGWRSLTGPALPFSLCLARAVGDEAVYGAYVPGGTVPEDQDSWTQEVGSDAHSSS